MKRRDEKPDNVVPIAKDWWPCACVKGGSVKHRRPSTHIKLHHPSVKLCRTCGVTKDVSDAIGKG